ncbi:MAG TPA: T9SS type A sorting domain-containing protein, partial [Bacteroidales bacterium]|nr:T9SS type A sorting domain-containing protein [Bacteroidales bacterium]
YPNPGSSELNVLIPENIKTTTFELYNSVGVLCKEEQFDSDRLNLNTNELKSGLYFYRLRQGNNIVSQGKWVKE